MQNDTKNLNVESMVDQFINQMVTEAGMDKDLEDDVVSQLKKDLKSRLEDRVNAVMLAQIPEHKLGEFEKLLEGNNEKEIQAFSTENIPNLPELIAAEFLAFRNRYIS